MPLEAEGNLRLALSAEKNNFLKVLVSVLVVISIRFIRVRRKDHSISLLDDTRRFYLVHQALFALEGLTDWATHGQLFSRIFRRRQGVR